MSAHRSEKLGGPERVAVEFGIDKQMRNSLFKQCLKFSWFKLEKILKNTHTRLSEPTVLAFGDEIQITVGTSFNLIYFMLQEFYKSASDTCQSTPS